MRHPLRSLLGQGAWYALGNVLAKVSGLVLLPVYTNTTYLSAEGYGLWGVFEVTVQIAIGLLGLQLGLGVIRYHVEETLRGRLEPTAWWATVALAGASVAVAAMVVTTVLPAEAGRLYLVLGAIIALEVMLTIPLSILRAREQAGRYMALYVLKLALVVAFNLAFLVGLRMGLFGLLLAYAAAGLCTVLAALAMTAPYGLLRPRFDGALLRRLVGFSAPLVVAGLGSMVLNASDRYVLVAMVPEEEVALYTLATKFGGVVNMFVVQPLQLAFLPILYRLAEEQRAEVLRQLLRYVVIVFGLLVVGLSAFTEPVLELLGSDAFYLRSVPLVPWIALGFGVFGVSVVFDGVLTLFHRTATSSWLMGLAAVLNLILNLLMVPLLGALGAAMTTLASYLVLLGGRYRASRRLLSVPYGWGPVLGTSLVTATAAFVGVTIPLPDGAAGWLVRGGLVAAWLAVLVTARWITREDVRNVRLLLRRGPGTA